MRCLPDINAFLYGVRDGAFCLYQFDDDLVRSLMYLKGVVTQ